MRHHSPVVLNCVVLAGLACTAAVGGETWSLPLFTSTPEDVLRRATERTVPDGTDLIVLDLEVSIRFSADGRVRLEKRTITRVLTASGVKRAATISEPYAPWRQDRPKVRYRVITADGRAHTLDEATISESGVPARAVAGLFSDRKILNAPLPAVAAGCVIEGEVIIEDRRTLFPGGQYLAVPLADKANVQHAKVRVEAPKEMRLTVASRRFTSERRDETDPAGIHRITLEATQINTGRKIMLPPEAYPFAAVEVSAGVTWKTFAAWYSGVVDKLAGPSPEAEARDPAAGLDQIAGALAALHKNVRYTGLELGMSSYIPHSPEETLDHGYGDCKDQSVLLVRDLRKAGFRASVALLTPYPSPDARAGAAGMELFTHAIVYLAGTQPLWIDPSSEYSTISHLPYADQGRHALIVDTASDGLVVTPENSVDENATKEDVEIILADNGKGRIKRHSEYQGAMADVLRPSFANTTTGGAMRKLFTNELGPSAKFDPVPSSDGNSFTINISSDAYSRAVTADGIASVTLPSMDVDFGPLALILVAAGTALHGTEDFYLSSTFRAERRTLIVPPSGYVAKPLPSVADVMMGPLLIERHAEIDKNGSIHLTNRLRCPTRRFSAKDAKSIADAMRTLTKAERTKFEFQKE